MCLTTQKAFHADVAVVMRRWLKQEEPFPEDQRPTTQAMEHYLNVRLLFKACRRLHWLLIIMNRTHCFHDGNAEVMFCQQIFVWSNTIHQWRDVNEQMPLFQFVSWPAIHMFHSWWSRFSLGSMETIWKCGTHCPKNIPGKGCPNKIFLESLSRD